MMVVYADDFLENYGVLQSVICKPGACYIFGIE